MAINAIQAAVRSMTGTERQFNGDLHAYWDQLGIPPGQFAERMVAWKQLPQNAAWIAATEDADALEGVDGLWRNGEQGVRFEASDLSTMFQDAAGTLPVYAPGQGQVDPPVGLLLDKRPGLVRGPELLMNGDFAAGNASWGVAGADATHVVDFTGGACRYKSDTTSPVLTVSQGSLSIVAGSWYELTIVVSNWVSGSVKTDSFSGAAPSGLVLASSAGTFRAIGLATASTSVFSFLRSSANVDLTIDSISIRRLPGNHAYQTTTTSRPTLSARYNLLTGTESLATRSVTVVATAYTLTTAGPGSVTLSGAASGTYTAGSRIITCTAGTLTLTVSGSVTQADLRVSNDGVGLPPYQRVVDANNYDTAGFPLYLKFDGVDDWMQTASIDFSGTDKIFLCAALRKLSDAASGIVAELSQNSSNVDGAFMLAAPSANGANKFRFVSKGTILADATTASAAYTAPFSGIVACRGSISGRTAEMRINGAVAATSALDQGAGNFSSAQLFIGRRGADGTLSFNGRLYSLLIRGAATPDTTIAKVEGYLNQKAKVF